MAIAADVPIIPVFTENIREATLCLSGRMNVGRGLWEYIYETPRPNVRPLPSQVEDSSGEAHLPNPRLSSFPNLQSFFKLGIFSGMTPEEMVNLTSNAVQEMIDQHQQLPGSVKRVCVTIHKEI